MRVGLFLIDLTPLSISLPLLRWGARIWFGLHARRRKIACDNILGAGVADTPEEARALAKRSFEHFAVVVVEALKTGVKVTEDTWPDAITLDVPDETRELIEAPGKGLIIVTGHIGNWEVAGQLMSYTKPVTAIARTMNNPYADRVMSRRGRRRVRIVSKRGVNFRKLIGYLRGGEILALLMDQHARAKGIVVDFMGRPASTHTTPAVLHLMTQCPIIVGACLREGPMKFRLHAGHPIVVEPTGDRQADIQEMTTRINGELGDLIRRAPEQYLWGHRRWRIVEALEEAPPDDNSSSGSA